MSAYTDATKIANYLGLTLTSPQQTQAGVLADAATAWVDRYTGQSWQVSSPVTDELHDVLGDRVYLDRRPVTAITSVKTRWAYPDSSETTLTAGQYELLDAAAGLLLLQGWGQGLALVTYTHTATAAPDDVALATTMIAASWLNQTLRPSTEGLDSVSVGQNDVTVKFSASRSDVPAEALTILKSYRTVIVA